MDFGTETGIFLAYTAGLMAVYFLGRALMTPLKWIAKLLVSSLVGGAALLAINTLGSSIGIFVPVNLITAVITGLTGVPGFIMLLTYFQFFA